MVSPGGHIDIGETAVSAAKRELKEETNLELQNIRFLTYQDEHLPKLKIHSVVLFFTAEAKGKPKPNYEVSEKNGFH